MRWETVKNHTGIHYSLSSNVVVKNLDHLSGDWSERNLMEDLLRRAVDVRYNAYCPYSGYAVGASLVDVGGYVHTGCNVERVSWCETSHAEQVALDSMVKKTGPNGRIIRIAIVGAPAGEKIDLASIPSEAKSIDEIGCPSCGRCLQCIWEHSGGNRDVQLLWNATGGGIGITTIEDAFPLRFGPNNLGL